MLHFVYDEVDPRTDIPFYVGVTSNPNARHEQHLCGLPISLSSTDMKSVNDRLDGLWVKTAKWFISQRRYVRKQSLAGSLISIMRQPCSLLAQTSFFIGFEPIYDSINRELRSLPFCSHICHTYQNHKELGSITPPSSLSPM